MAKTVMPISNNNSQHNNILDDYSNILLPVEVSIIELYFILI